MHTFQYLNAKLKHGVNDKVRTDLDLHKGSNLGMGVYAIERSYPKVGVGQIWKQYLKQLKNYAHLWNLNIVLTRTPTPTPVTGCQHKLTRDIVLAS